MYYPRLLCWGDLTWQNGTYNSHSASRSMYIWVYAYTKTKTLLLGCFFFIGLGLYICIYIYICGHGLCAGPARKLIIQGFLEGQGWGCEQDTVC